MTTTKQHDFNNRLTLIASVPSSPPAAPVAAAIACGYGYNDANQGTCATQGDGSYDWQGRRIHKRTWSQGVTRSNLKFRYGGWNLVAQVEVSGNEGQYYVWGSDLSGSLQGAGGVGGLLAINDVGADTSFVGNDGNGNVAGLVRATDGTVAARYEYGPFGEVLRATGPLVKVNPFRFSTKYQDDEMDLLYYGFRSYSANTGRWQSRDPVGEDAFFALFSAKKPSYSIIRLRQATLAQAYLLSHNDPVDNIDLLGLWIPGPDGTPSPPHPVPSGPPKTIDCSGNSKYYPATCTDCRGKRVNDWYPGKAHTICNGFAEMYTDTLMQDQAACTAQCLIEEEEACQSKYQNCSDRDCCRLNAHVHCYTLFRHAAGRCPAWTYAVSASVRTCRSQPLSFKLHDRLR